LEKATDPPLRDFSLRVPERRACRVLGQHRSTQRKPPSTPEDEAASTANIVALVTRYGCYGCCRVTVLLREAGWAVNRKRVERSPVPLSMAAGGAQGARQATQEGPALAQRRLLHPAAADAPEPRLVLRLRRGPHPLPAGSGQSVATRRGPEGPRRDGRKYRMLDVVDEFTREGPRAASGIGFASLSCLSSRLRRAFR
jgi:hypothetical protein